MTDAVRLPAALSAYIRRVGAEQLNFRRFIIRIYKKQYYIERALIKINNVGDIACTSDEFAPSKEEAAAIKIEVAEANWPKAIIAPNTDLLKIAKGRLFEFWDLERKGIIMCQERINKDDGGKAYVPWTFFSDGKWRAMEPDTNLPFWKPEETRNKTAIMIHEGAKAAAFVDGLVNNPERKKELAAHPWGEELARYEHWGMIGGALAPHRADYNELWKEKPLEVVYVCDNDFPGAAALPKVSEYYGRQMKGIRFSNDFDHGWDMADPLPKHLFKAGRWVGHKLERYKVFATFATERAPIEGRGKPALVLRDGFAREWYHAITPDVYIHKDWPNKIYTAAEFDDVVNNFSKTSTTSRLVKAHGVIKSPVIKYNPSKPSGIYVSGTGEYINTHCQSAIDPVYGDAGPWLEFCEHLFPIERDRIEVQRWVATLISRPDIKMMYALLLISETQGVGKSTLGERILEPIIGSDNTSHPSENDVVNSDYTYWMAHKRLAVVNEIYAGHSSKAYNQLKATITDPVITVRQKYLADYNIDNWLHILACSNNFNALRLTGEDRRWFIPKVTEKKKPETYWKKFNAWLSDGDGLGIIMFWAKEFLKSKEAVGHGEAAPWSTTKLTVIEEGDSAGMQMAANIFEALKSKGETEGDPFYRCVLMDQDFVGLIKDNIYDGRNSDYLERPSTIRKVAVRCGWFVSEAKTQFRDGTRGRLICLDAEDAHKPPNALFREVIPTRIRLLGKKVLAIDDGGNLSVTRKELQDPLVIVREVNGAKSR